MANADFEMRN